MRRARLLGIARDTEDSIGTHIAAARDADVLVTIGGASVGDHDLVAPALTARGMALDFWKVALRPGKPLMFGRLWTRRACSACPATRCRRSSAGAGVPGALDPVRCSACANVARISARRGSRMPWTRTDRACT